MRNHPLLCLIACMAFAMPCHGGQTVAELRGIPLQWKPTEAISSHEVIDRSAYRHARFVIRRFSDDRKQTARIGVNTEKRLANRDLAVTTKQDVAEWLTARVAGLFSQFGMTVVNGRGNVFVDAAVVTFFVREGSNYDADVSLRVTLTALNGRVIWKGTTTGSATRFGRSYSAENYYEALSNATTSAVHGLLNDDSFKQAVQKSR